MSSENRSFDSSKSGSFGFQLFLIIFFSVYNFADDQHYPFSVLLMISFFFFSDYLIFYLVFLQIRACRKIFRLRPN